MYLCPFFLTGSRRRPRCCCSRTPDWSHWQRVRCCVPDKEPGRTSQTLPSSPSPVLCPVRQTKLARDKPFWRNPGKMWPRSGPPRCEIPSAEPPGQVVRCSSWLIWSLKRTDSSSSDVRLLSWRSHPASRKVINNFEVLFPARICSYKLIGYAAGLKLAWQLFKLLPLASSVSSKNVVFLEELIFQLFLDHNSLPKFVKSWPLHNYSTKSFYISIRDKTLNLLSLSPYT